MRQNTSSELSSTTESKNKVEILGRLARVTGLKFVEELQSLHVQIHYKYPEKQIATKTTDRAMPSKIVRMLPQLQNYYRNDYYFLMDGRRVFLTAFEKKQGTKAEHLPTKVLQIDFLMDSDYQLNPYDRQNYDRVISRDNFSGSGLYSESSIFLKKLKKLVESSDQSCTIQLVIQDDRREEFYKRALKGFSNVRFVKI